MLIRFIYTLVLTLLAPLLLFKLYQKKAGKPSFGQRWVEHFGFSNSLPPQKTKPIWIHAVSVGESIAIIPLIKKLKAQYPYTTILVTTTTSTGAAQIKKLGDLVEHRYMPIDFSWCVKLFIKRINPAIMLIVETELWPNTLTTVNNKDIPIIVINARLSARSAKRYQALHFIWNMVSKNVSHVSCLHEDDAKRFLALGIVPGKVSVTGSLKYDINVPSHIQAEGVTLRKKLGENRSIILAASTHQGEEKILLASLAQLQKINKSTLLIIVPRHPERFNSVEQLCISEQINVVRRTSNSGVSIDTSVYLADTMGEMLTLIAASDITFMGGSLLGERVGGHNFIEPAALAKPIVTGNSYYNFADLALQLLANDALIVCNNEKELTHAFTKLLSDSASAQKMGKNAKQIVVNNQGAVQETIATITHFLPF